MEYVKLFIFGLVLSLGHFNFVFWLKNKIDPESNLYPLVFCLSAILFSFGGMLIPLFLDRDWGLLDYFACSFSLSLTLCLAKFIWDRKQKKVDKTITRDGSCSKKHKGSRKEI